MLDLKIMKFSMGEHVHKPPQFSPLSGTLTDLSWILAPPLVKNKGKIYLMCLKQFGS